MVKMTLNDGDEKNDDTCCENYKKIPLTIIMKMAVEVIIVTES